VRLAFYGRLQELPEIIDFVNEEQLVALIKAGLVEREDRVKASFIKTLFSTIATDFEKLFSLIVMIGLDEEKKMYIQQLLQEYFKKDPTFRLQYAGILMIIGRCGLDEIGSYGSLCCASSCRNLCKRKGGLL
jgi:hypothetical protein